MILNINGSEYFSRVDDSFSCFIKLMVPNSEFVCERVRVNENLLRDYSQMSAGLMAYELTLGKQALRASLVSIFNYEESDLTSNPVAQSQFFDQWIHSLK